MALSPINVTSNINCIKMSNSLLNPTDGDTQTDLVTEVTQTNFFDSTDYRKVYKNFNYNDSIDTWIYEGNTEDKLVGYKLIQSYPYDTVKFKIGDYIHWNSDNSTQLSTWLITSLDSQYLYNVKGRMLLCNNNLKWQDENGNINCYPCVIKDTLTYTNLKWGSKGLVEQGGDIVVMVQKNNITSEISVNDRFLFNSVAFKVKQFFDELNPNYMQLYMTKSAELQDDNIDTNIAANNPPVADAPSNGIFISPNLSEILEGETQTFTVYNYVNGNTNTDSFTITVSGVPTTNYTLTIINNNSFSIVNNNQYSKNPLIITALDNESQESITQQIWLGGIW